MSGGSFNYLADHADDLGNHVSDLQHMLNELDESFTASAAAIDTHAVLMLLARAEVLANQLYDVWHAVEWWRSNDSSHQQAAMAVERYERKSEPPPVTKPIVRTLPRPPGMQRVRITDGHRPFWIDMEPGSIIVLPEEVDPAKITVIKDDA